MKKERVKRIDITSHRATTCGENEGRHLEQRLRSFAGRIMFIAGISAGMMLLPGCGAASSEKSAEAPQLTETLQVLSVEDTAGIEGIMPLPEDTVSCVAPQVNGTAVDEVRNKPEADVKQRKIETEPEEDTDSVKIYEKVEQMPEFPGGDEAMLRFFSEHIQAPSCPPHGFDQLTVVKFHIDTSGHVCEPRVIRSSIAELDEAVMKAVGLLPDFTPGQHKGKKVNVWVTVPFRLKIM